MECSTPEARKVAVQGRRGYACTFCRRRKFVGRFEPKCDGRTPCKSCIKSKQTCNYDNSAHRTPTQLLQDRIDELQNKINTIESSRRNSPRSPPTRRQQSVPSQSRFPITNSYSEGEYVFSSSEYSTPGPSRSLFVSPSNAPYVADYVTSDCSSSCSSSYGAAFGVDGNYLPNAMAGSTSLSGSPSTAWDTPAFESGSPQLVEPQANHILGSDGSISPQLAEQMLQQHNLNTQRHPALLSAAYLLGCFFSLDGSLAGLEPLFIERTRRALEDAIDLTQDFSYSIDYLLASVMLALYYYFKGRLLEGYHRAISAVRFAVNHGFHAIAPLSIGTSTCKTTFMPPLCTTKRIEFTFFIDRWGSLLTGLPCGIADDDIKTPWPQTLDDIIDQVPDRISSPYYGYALKALALLDRASVQASSAHTTPPEIWAAKHTSIKNAIARFANEIEAIRETTNVGDGATLSLVYIIVYAATCALHMPYIRQWAHDDSRTSERNHLRSICKDGASTATAILRNLREVTAVVIPVWQGLPLAALCEYLLQERDDLIDELDFAEQAEVDKQLDEMVGWMHDMRGTFPVLGMQADKLDTKRR
ncbi:GAL4-like Zn(II)2Cys6 (or C6 zinc) binuclear cluster DNA-binding domain [Rhizoctonia solani]|uniref:GAL4-like Zn(II)2Cys6 (Or C6 zinc) binuclear cluster DNA-binding domain n=1 Tax=Rhizoctonia solani TaxID=456999 RepID=A0A8H7M8G8_9AGAM|nr:GAL4-like Zn(II)2Cys6 (or C6 zinc) binuclear cluster DNA-binding domain [Rhizoctonia solani]